MHLLLSLLALTASTVAQSTKPYIGGDQFGSYYTNPNLINSFLSQVGGVNPACNSIPGVGQPVLALKQLLQGVDAQLDAGNRDSAVRVVFFRERKNSTTFQSNYKLVLQVRTYATNSYIAVEGVYRQVGAPAFEVLTYYVDSDIDRVRSALGESSVDANGFVGCGDVKSIYTMAASGARRPVAQTNTAQNNVDPAIVAQVIALLQKQQNTN